MANPNAPTSEPESVLSGHTMEKARGGIAPLVTLLAASVVTGVARQANAEVRCDPVNFSIQRSDGSTSVAGTVTPRSDSNMRVDATFGERNDRSYGMTVKPGDACTDQAGIDVTVNNRRGPHLNACACESGLCLFHTSRNAQGGRVADGHTSMPIPRCVETQTPPPPQNCGNRTCDPGETTISCPADCIDGDPQRPHPPVCNNDGTCDTPRETTANCRADCPPPPDPREVFNHLPQEFTVQARFEESPHRSPGMASGQPLSVTEAFTRGLLREIQYGLDQLPAPEGMDFNNAQIFPDGNGGLYIYVGKSASPTNYGAPYEAVYRAHMAQSDQPQNLRFVRIAPARGSEIGSGGPQTLPVDAVLSVRDGEFHVRPRESSVSGPRCDAIALPAEGVTGKNPVTVLCELIGRLGRRAVYVGSAMIDGTNLTDPNAVAALRRANNLAIANREPGVNAESESIDLASVALLLERMPSVYDDEVPEGVRVLDAAAVRFFVGRNLPETPATPATRPTPPLPSAPPVVAPPAQAPGSFRPHRVQNRRPA